MRDPLFCGRSESALACRHNPTRTDTEIFRSDRGWEWVIDLLESGDDEPVVCSYTVCDEFPYFSLLPNDHPLKQREDDESYDKIYEMPDGQRFSLCMGTLRASDPWLELKPDSSNQYHFRDGYSVFDLTKSMYGLPGPTSAESQMAEA